MLSEQAQKMLLDYVAEDLFTDADRPFRFKAELKQKVREHQQWDLYKQGLREQKVRDVLNSKV